MIGSFEIFEATFLILAMTKKTRPPRQTQQRRHHISHMPTHLPRDTLMLVTPIDGWLLSVVCLPSPPALHPLSLSVTCSIILLCHTRWLVVVCCPSFLTHSVVIHTSLSSASAAGFPVAVVAIT
jgi:hypothetical protein